MTLSRFLRDYLYIPLGGNRRGRRARYVNLMLTMLLGGLWHGANWTSWPGAGCTALFLLVNHAWRSLRGERETRAGAMERADIHIPPGDSGVGLLSGRRASTPRAVCSTACVASHGWINGSPADSAAWFSKLVAILSA